MSVANFLESISRRRSIYNIGKNVSLSQEEIVNVIEEVVEQSPSAFHAQSSRVVVLFGYEHQKLWNIVKDTLRPMIPAEQFAQTEGKIDGCFAAGVGTVLFFEDQEVIKGQQAQFPLYADKFPEFSEQHAGMAQFMVWTALSELGLGATLLLLGLCVRKCHLVPSNKPQSLKPLSLALTALKYSVKLKQM